MFWAPDPDNGREKNNILKENITSRYCSDLTLNQFSYYIQHPRYFSEFKTRERFFNFVFPVHRVTGRGDVKDHVTILTVCGWLQNEYIRRGKFGFRYFWHLRSLFGYFSLGVLSSRHEVLSASNSLLCGSFCSRNAGEWRSSSNFFKAFIGFYLDEY